MTEKTEKEVREIEQSQEVQRGVSCPYCGKRLDGKIEYGCHCDLEPGMEPDECVFDNGDICDCIYAERLQKAGKKKYDCEYWREKGN